MSEFKDLNVYDPPYLALLQRSYEDACDRLGMTPDTPEAERNELAKLVMTVVASGEREASAAASTAIVLLRAKPR